MGDSQNIAILDLVTFNSLCACVWALFQLLCARDCIMLLRGSWPVSRFFYHDTNKVKLQRIGSSHRELRKKTYACQWWIPIRRLQTFEISWYLSDTNFLQWYVSQLTGWNTLQSETHLNKFYVSCLYLCFFLASSGVFVNKNRNTQVQNVCNA